MKGVFHMEEYHPVQAGSIDGTDTVAHDGGVNRALFAYLTEDTYRPLDDPNVIGEPKLTLFIGNLSLSTTENELKEAMEKFGEVQQLRLVRDLVTGASKRYAFVEFKTYSGMWRAYRDSNNLEIQGSRIIVEWNRQRLMPGWIPRRFGGGLGGQKTSGQLRFGGRNRPFRAPIREIPVQELQKKEIPVPKKSFFISNDEVPPLPDSMVDAIRKEKAEKRKERHKSDHSERKKSRNR